MKLLVLLADCKVPYQLKVLMLKNSNQFKTTINNIVYNIIR